MPARQDSVERLVSAGGVVYRVENGDVAVVLCGRKTPLLWALPKGAPDPGESLEQTAQREVSEETGLQVRLEAPIDRIQYWFVRSADKVRCFKTVHFYLASAQGGSTRDHDPEFDEVRWFPMDEAVNVMTYGNERKIVQRAAQMIQERVRAT